MGENRGYSISEGPDLEVSKGLQQYVPFVRFEVHPVASEDLVNEEIKALLG